MRVFIRIIAFFIIIFFLVYFFAPNLFHKKVYDLDKLDIKEFVITPNPAKIFKLNLKISSTNVYNVNSIAGATQLYFDALYTFKINVVELLEDSVNKKLTLMVHIKQLESMQRKLETAISTLENNVSDENIKYEEYRTQKEQWDQDFSAGFQQKDVALVLNWFNNSYKNWPLATKHRILKNWNLVVLNKLKKIKYLIDSKLNVLNSESDTIVNNFYLIKWDLLQKLRHLKYQLDNNIYTE